MIAPDSQPHENAGMDLQLDATLVEQHRLSPAEVECVRETMVQTGMGFEDAVRSLGLLSARPEVTAGSETAETARSEERSVVARALERLSTSRQMVLRQGAEAVPCNELQRCFDPYHPRNERMRMLRTELLLLAEPSQYANVVPVLSASPGEGRSQLCAELAICFAQLGRSTLLVDADLRHPRQHVLFGTEHEFGLANGLEEDSRPLVHPVRGLSSLSLCTSGVLERNPLELLSNGRFGRLLYAWGRDYEFILIDTPPATLYADSLAIASIVGRVLLVAHTGETSFKRSREMLKRLEATRARLLGAVMQKF